MTLELDEQEQLTLIAALKLASIQYYREAWEISGPRGVHPNALVFGSLMARGDECCELGKKLGDPMD